MKKPMVVDPMYPVRDESGFVLVASLCVLTVLMLLGLAAMNTMIFEKEIGGNIKRHEQAVYEAEAGAELGTEIIEQSFSCSEPFQITTEAGQLAGEAVLDGNVVVEAGRLTPWMHDYSITPPDDITGGRDAYFPFKYGGGPHTNLNMTSNRGLSSGSAIQMAAGYLGKGKSAAQGGGHVAYDICAEHIGLNNSSATVLLQWRHVIGQEGSCDY